MKRLFALCSLLFALSATAAVIDTDSAKTIVAPKIEYNVSGGALSTIGKTKITNNAGQSLTLANSNIANKGANVDAQNIEMVLGDHVYLTADKITRNHSDTVATDTMFTACNGCDAFGNAWEITTSKMTHDADAKLMEFYNPVFYAYDVPVFWLPYINIPDPSVKHKSGILIPDFNSTNNMGTQFNLPVHIALSDTHDLTAIFSYLTAENPLFQLEHRLNADHAEFRTTGSFTHNRAGENRWHIFNDDTIELGEYARAQIFLERSSDKTYLQKYGFYDDQPYLDSGARLDLFGQSGYITADMHIFQELRSTRRNVSVPSGDILPNIRGVYQTSNLFGETYATFGADVLGIMDGSSLSQRAIGMATLISPWTLPFGNRVTASVSARYDIYNFTNTIMSDGTDYTGLKTRFLPSAYAEWGLPLVKRSRAESGWTQIIEPRARITIMPGLDDAAYAMNNDSAGALLSDATLFSDNRYSGLDLWENGTFADYGVRYAAHRDDSAKFEVFVGQTYDFDRTADVDPNSGFRRGASDYVGRVGLEAGGWLGLSNRFRFDRDSMDLRHMETDANIRVAPRTYINAGHIWATQFIDSVTMDRDIHEVSGGIGIGLTNRLSMRFNAIYNITDARFQRHTGGVYYDHPCYFLSLEYRRDNAIKEDYVGNTTFQFRFGISLNGVKQ